MYALTGGGILISPPLPQNGDEPTVQLITSKTSISLGISSECNSRPNCLSCLFGVNNAVRNTVPMLDNQCVWCASSNLCMPAAGGKGLKCDDFEERACPAILHDLPPNNHRVIHVAIRKGGPEALIQLHLALNYWGFRTTLDTRSSKKQKGGDVVPFFKEAYRKEFELAPPLRWVRNYASWLDSGADGDVLIATETWECRAVNKDSKGFYDPDSVNGVRQLQWHLTVWTRKERSECSIVGHTNYVAMSYMRQSKRALLFPYISPHILQLADKKIQMAKDAGHESLLSVKKNLVLYDSDTKLKNSDLESGSTQHETKIATGYTPSELYNLYVQAKVGIDLRLPGGERFIYEASLFDVCVIVDKSLNGGNVDDFPIPESFRVRDPNDLQALNRAKDLCISSYGKELVASFEPLRTHVRHQRVGFHRHVRRYFSNSVFIVTAVLSERDAKERLIPFLLATLYQLPFAVIEVLFTSEALRDAVLQADLQSLKINSLMAAVVFRVVEPSGGVGITDPNLDLSEGLRQTVSLLLSPSGAKTQLSIFLKASRYLYTSILPLGAATGFDGDFVNFLGSQISLAAEDCQGNLLRRQQLIQEQFQKMNVNTNVHDTQKDKDNKKQPSVDLNPICKTYKRGMAVADSLKSGSRAIIALFWRTSESEAALSALRSHRHFTNNNDAAAVTEMDFRFVEVENTQTLLPKLAESDYYRLLPTTGKDEVDAGNLPSTHHWRQPAAPTNAKLVMEMQSVLRTTPMAPSLSVSTAPEATLRHFFCEHELWQRLVDNNGQCPFEIPFAPAGPM